MAFVPRVVDMYHGEQLGAAGFKPAADAGIWGIIHKASEGSGYTDNAYATRRKLAAAENLLWGAYHFNDGSPVTSQISRFFSSAEPDDKTLMVIDYEDNQKSQMSIQMLCDFLRAGEQQLGRKLAIYSGNRLKEQIGKLGPADLAYVNSHRLWLCQYGPVAKLPKGFKSYWLWQYTGDGTGPTPHTVPGIDVPGGSGIDLNVYNGTQEQLITEWK